MDYCFNELSTTPLAIDINDARNRMDGFIQTCKEAYNVGFKYFRVEENFSLTQLTDENNYRIVEWLIDSNVDQDKRTFLLSLLQVYEIAHQINEAEFENYKEATINGFADEPTGFVLTYLTQLNGIGALCVSFLSVNIWDTSRITINYSFNDENQVTQTISVEIYHASRPEHISYTNSWRTIPTDTHKSWALKRSLEFELNPRIPSINIPLPYLNKSDKLVQNNSATNPDWGSFRQFLLTLAPNDRTAILRATGKDVAEINGYEYSNRLSNCNGSNNAIRDIYQLSNGEAHAYLSVDIRHGGYEVYNGNGVHQGQIFFNGEWEQEADTSGQHDINTNC